MADGSQTGWYGLAPTDRYCAGCGEKLTLKPPKHHTGPFDDWHLWHQHHPTRRTWHSHCRKDPDGSEDR